MKNLFFDKITVPEFLKNFFEADDWYLVLGDLKNILRKNVKNTPERINVKSVKVKGDVQVGENCNFGEYVVIEGPVYIGDNVEICTGAYIRPGSVIGNNCSIGHAAEVKNAIMMDGSKIANHAFLGDSIIGARARLGGHCETTNRRFDQKPIDFIFEDKKIKTGLDKLGMILGEDSRLGGDVLPAPGTAVGKKSFVETGLTIQGFIPPNSYVKKIQEYEIRENRFEGKLNNKYRFME